MPTNFNNFTVLLLPRIIGGLTSISSSDPLGLAQGAYVPSYYLPTSLTWISWDAPLIGHTGIDLDYKMTGYDWFNRELTWSLVSPPAGATIDADGTLHWTPSVEAEQSITVRMTVGGLNYDKTFTCDVDNSRCVFVADTGSDAAAGTEVAPYLSLGRAFEDVGVSLTTGTTNKLIYVRGGSYTLNNLVWVNQTAGTPYRKISQSVWTQSNPLFIRGYPEERPQFNLTGTSAGMQFSEGVIVQNLDLVGEALGTNAGENGALVLWGACVAKRITCRDYANDFSQNCTGVQAAGGCILDQVYAHDNYDRAAPAHHNSSNFLFYLTHGVGDVFVIDCVSGSYSATGFKIKHAGAGVRLHIHRSVSYGTYMPWGGAGNGTSVRHSLFYKDSTILASPSAEFAFGWSVTDQFTAGNNNVSVGMLCDTNTIISDSTEGEALYQRLDIGEDGSATPCWYSNNTVVTASTANGSVFNTHTYDTVDPSWTVVFNYNEFISPSIATPVRIGSGAGGLYALSKLNDYGVANTGTTVRRDLVATLSGATWVYDEALKTLYKDGLAVAGDEDVGSAMPNDLAAYQLAAGHYAIKKFDMTIVAPRPDSETGGAFVAADYASVRAQHRWAYYDGVNPVRYEYAVKVFGGAAPHMYTLVNAPAGMTIGNDRNAANHGIIKWVPQAAFSAAAPATVEVLITDQGGETVTVSFTVQTTASTEKFMFMSQSGNDSTGDGTIGAPFATLFKFTGATQATTTYPNRIVYMRGSATPYVTVAHTDAWNGGNAIETIKSRCHLIQARHPAVYLSFPDETVSIDFSGSQFECNSHDLTFGGSSTAPLMILGSADNAAETHNFWLNAFHRGQFRHIRFDGFVPRTNAAWTNSAPMFSPSATPTNRQYYSLHDVVEINRTETYTNDGLLHVFFSTDYWVEEYCGGSRVGQGCAYKDTNYHTSVRYGDYDNGGGDYNFAFNFMGQSGSGDNEILYSKVIGRLFFNGQAQATSYVHHAARNTIYTRDSNYAEGLKAWDSAGPFTSVDNVIVAWTPSVSTNITSTGNECHVIRNSTDIPINLTTLELVNATTDYRDLYLGTRGWEIQ